MLEKKTAQSKFFYRSCNFHGVSPQFLQPFFIDSAVFPCSGPAIPSARTFHGVKILSAIIILKEFANFALLQIFKSLTFK